MKRKQLTEEERALWLAVMRDVRPLKKNPQRPTPAATAPTSEAKPAPASRQKKSSPPPVPPPAPRPQPPSELEHGRATGIDRRSADRLRRGRLAIDGRLDLHGMTQAAASERLAEFIAGGFSAGKRCLLVITGKGLTGKGPTGKGPTGKEPARDGGGILREQVPRWLNQAPNRARVLAFTYAQPQHGGMGALYVLLKRRRET